MSLKASKTDKKLREAVKKNENPKDFLKSQYLADNYLSFQGILVKRYPYLLYRKILLQILIN